LPGGGGNDRVYGVSAGPATGNRFVGIEFGAVFQQAIAHSSRRPSMTCKMTVAPVERTVEVQTLDCCQYTDKSRAAVDLSDRLCMALRIRKVL